VEKNGSGQKGRDFERSYKEYLHSFTSNNTNSKPIIRHIPVLMYIFSYIIYTYF
jgi:hypothetical protein